VHAHIIIVLPERQY